MVWVVWVVWVAWVAWVAWACNLFFPSKKELRTFEALFFSLLSFKIKEIMSLLTKIQSSSKLCESSLCVGIDPEITSIPKKFFLKKYTINDSIKLFCKEIVRLTAPYCSAFKPQLAMFSSIGCENSLDHITSWIKSNYPNHLLLIDGKRGDIGNTSNHYANESFKRYMADACTVNPYMGSDSIEPFLKWKDKGIFVICRTSNPSSLEIQDLTLNSGEKVFEKIALLSQKKWNKNNQVGLVVGATASKELELIKKKFPALPLLIPGIGSQGGSLEEVKKILNHSNAPDLNKNKTNNFLITISRTIIYSSNKNNDWEDSVIETASKFNSQINY